MCHGRQSRAELLDLRSGQHALFLRLGILVARQHGARRRVMVRRVEVLRPNGIVENGFDERHDVALIPRLSRHARVKLLYVDRRNVL